MTLDQATRRKLELYQEMFYLLQTRPEYLARLFRSLERIDMTEKAKKTVENVVMTLYGYAQNPREEFLLLKLFQVSQPASILEILEETKRFLLMGTAIDPRGISCGHDDSGVHPRKLHLHQACHPIRPKWEGKEVSL